MDTPKLPNTPSVPDPAADLSSESSGILSRVFGANGYLARTITAPLRWSLATKASCLLAIALLAIVAIVWFLFSQDPNSVPWRHSLTEWRIGLTLLLLLVIPLVTYWLLRLWLEGDASRFPDLDHAWNLGVESMRRNGIRLDTTPIFLIIGSASVEQEKAIISASRRTFRTQSVPEGQGPLHWYADSEAILLFCSGASWLSALSSLAEKRSNRNLSSISQVLASRIPMPPSSTESEASVPTVIPQPESQPQPTGPTAPQPVPATTTKPQAASPVDPASATDWTPPSHHSQSQSRGTVMLDDYSAGQQSQEKGPGQQIPGSRVSPGMPLPTGTASDIESFTAAPVPPSMPLPTEPVAKGSGGVLKSETPPSIAPAASQTPEFATNSPRLASVDAEPIGVSALEAGVQVDRLGYLAQRLRTARQPLCAINGVLTLLPFEILQSRNDEIAELENAAKADLVILQENLELEFPVTAMVTGLERETGFSELVRRVGRQRAAVQRFGKGFDLRCIATSDELAALSVHVCGTFEDWIYTLFREREALTRPGNTKLYGLLCKVRSNLRERLTNLLSRGFGFDESRETQHEPFAFSGCYFAATGSTEDRQAFVKGVIDKLIEEQEQVEWTSREITFDKRYRFASNLMILLSIALAIVLVISLQ